ncbi:MAG: Transcription-repair coupling factor [candidate division WS6 bacterium GW2011_GWC2_36_7]|uniref:Transcription-repair coupling factor n=1 Tax=candidate division WS6 bacterium GW2011_GWC2_36_7 TaxID=1619091 RepID=A0A0G0EVT1_9BACT|nr:MAG: Transcription-repair coupling factor [candidate division WS6 bacterium GW2011_GWC2_36_7]
MNDGFLNKISGDIRQFKEEILSKNKVSGVDSNYYELTAEILGKALNKRVWLLLSDLESTQEKILNIKLKEKFEIKKFLDLGYERVERVWNEGEVSILGDVVIVWPYSMNNVVRISLYGEEIENIDILDIHTRKKIRSVDTRLFLSSGVDIFLGNEEAAEDVNIKIMHRIGDQEDCVDLGIRTIPGIENFSNTKVVTEIIKNFRSRDFKIWYVTKDSKGFENNPLKMQIEEIFSTQGSLEKQLSRGFVLGATKTLVLTDLEILGEVDLFKYQKVDRNVDPSSVAILKKIIPGDFIVHEDHGIGKFGGIQERNGGQYIEIAYAGLDRLYVPLSAADKVTKYIGAGKKRPLLTGLNSGVWKRISLRAKEKVEEIAKELLQLYALRKTAQAPVMIDSEEALDGFWTFASQFKFTDTDDQLLATKQIADDFQKDKPMDRLLVGDVGFGKTEMAMRAAYAVANAGYQVAVLAPTTILVEQHKMVFQERFKNYPFNIVSLSRFSTETEKAEVLKGLNNGVVDIVIGTHSLLSADVKFKNMGLLIVDEEQKFGVKQKEKLKEARVDTNVLSLTATPIPRTLNMALTGIRDISVLAIPPLGRKEIINHFEKFNWDSVLKAISKEMERNGQVYFLHNRVGNMQNIEQELKKLFPKANIQTAHGQMNVETLTRTMADFVDRKIDILICTTIIENGLDIPTANTLIIDDATKLGLSQMYQIRGRIGRSLEQGYAYFYYDTLQGDAEQRLTAIRDSQALGSGFLLSNRDLEIRGSGDILGRSQSGTINSVGYGLYTQILQEAVDDLRRKQR